LILLTIVLIFGKEINGSKAWLHIFGISIQPSEITKIALSLYSIKILSENKNLLHLLIITIIPSILTFLEPDTGAIIIYIIIFLSLLYFYKIKKKHIILSLSIISIFIIANIFLYYLNKDLLIKLYGTNLFYRIDRIIMFKNQNNIQSINSLISIGSHNLIYIPENHNDFIFASIISKYSPIIFLLITSCYLLIFYYYIKNIKKKKSTSNIINFIILNMLLFQTFYNILMNLSLVPIIGIPIPFLSYGGSYLLILYTLIGISINLNNKKVV
jgi:rod shape determining protein RodA